MSVPEAVRRRDATQATIDRFVGKPLDWKVARHCIKMAHFHLRKMGRKVQALPRIQSPLAARRELKERGWESVSDMLDSLLMRIPPASMVIGDLAAVPGEGGLDAIFVCDGRRRLFGWHGSAEGAVFVGVGLEEVTGSWRV